MRYGVIFLAAAAMALCAVSCNEKAPPKPAPPTVQVLTVSPRDVTIYQRWVGTLDGYTNAQIRAQVSGYLLKQNYAEGGKVKQGDLLFEIDSRPFQAALDAALAKLAQDQALLGKTELDVKRFTPLAKDQAISQEELDDAVQSNLAAKAAVTADNATVENARLNLGFTKIISPVDGIAGVAQAQIGDLVGPGTGNLTTVSTVDPIRAYFNISEQFYLTYGRQFATVRTEVRPIPPAAVGLTFVIKEGPKVKVGKITFEGNKHVKSRVLRSAMKNLKPIGLPHSIFLENLFAKTYDATKLDEDTERVREELQDLGYFTAVVQTPQTRIHDTGHTGFHVPLLQSGPGKAVDLTIPIEEGERYRLGGITFKNNKALNNAKALRGLFPIKDGDIADRSKIAKGLENLRKAYGQFGYINFTAIPTPRPDEAKKLLYFDIDIDEGKPFTVRRIEFTGNTTTRDKVIRREIALEEGQVYNQAAWEQSLLRLNQLGYFDQLKPDDPDVTDRHLDDKEGTVDLTLKVKEKGKNSI